MFNISKIHYLFFIRVFSFFGQINPTSTQTDSLFAFLSIFCGPSDAFLQICLCKFNRTIFQISHTFSSIVPYWHDLEKTWSKQVP